MYSLKNLFSGVIGKIFPHFNSGSKTLAISANETIDSNEVHKNRNQNQPAKEMNKIKKTVKKLKFREHNKLERFTIEVVNEYVGYETQIHNLEKKNILKKYETKLAIFDEVNKTLSQMEAVKKELRKQIEKKKADLENFQMPTMKQFLQQIEVFEPNLARQQRELSELQKKLESNQKDLNSVKMQYYRAQQLVDFYKKYINDLKELYKKQQSIFYALFSDYHTTPELSRYLVLEEGLEDELDWLQRVEMAKFKWDIGRSLLVHSSTQFSFGLLQWHELERMDDKNPRSRYFIASEVRGLFTAAIHNIRNCQIYIGRVKFPHVTEVEITNVEHTMNSVFTSDLAHHSALLLKNATSVFQSTHHKVVLLIAKKHIKLREIRLELLRKRSLSDLGAELKIEYEPMPGLTEPHFDELKSDQMEVFYDDGTTKSSRNDVGTNTDEELYERNELALPLPPKLENSKVDRSSYSLPTENPLPTPLLVEAIFGDMRKKISEYNRTRKNILRWNELGRVQQTASLKEKISERRKQLKNDAEKRVKASQLPVSTSSIGSNAATKRSVEVRRMQYKKSKSPKSSSSSLSLSSIVPMPSFSNGIDAEADQ